MSMNPPSESLVKWSLRLTAINVTFPRSVIERRRRAQPRRTSLGYGLSSSTYLTTLSLPVTLWSMRRNANKSVTVSILLPAAKEWAEGTTYFEEPIRVRAFTNDDMDLSTPNGKETWKEIPAPARIGILKTVELIRALHAGDHEATEKAILALNSEAGPLVRMIVNASLKEPGYTQDVLVRQLCQRLEDVRFVLWKTEGRLEPGILCADIQTAFSVHTLMSAVGATSSVRLCPNCGKTFMQTRADQDHCSGRCRDANRMRRFRSRQKSESPKAHAKAEKVQRPKRGAK